MGVEKQVSSSFRRGLSIGIPVATVIGLTTLAYAGLTIFNPGDKLSASTINANFAELQSQIATLQSAVATIPKTPHLVVVATSADLGPYTGSDCALNPTTGETCWTGGPLLFDGPNCTGNAYAFLATNATAAAMH